MCGVLVCLTSMRDFSRFFGGYSVPREKRNESVRAAFLQTGFVRVGNVVTVVTVVVVVKRTVGRLLSVGR